MNVRLAQLPPSAHSPMEKQAIIDHYRVIGVSQINEQITVTLEASSGQ